MSPVIWQDCHIRVMWPLQSLSHTQTHTHPYRMLMRRRTFSILNNISNSRLYIFMGEWQFCSTFFPVCRFLVLLLGLGDTSSISMRLNLGPKVSCLSINHMLVHTYLIIEKFHCRLCQRTRPDTIHNSNHSKTQMCVCSIGNIAPEPLLKCQRWGQTHIKRAHTHTHIHGHKRVHVLICRIPSTLRWLWSSNCLCKMT